VEEITQRVLTGQDVLVMGSEYRVVGPLPPNHEIFNRELPALMGFVGELKELCDAYFESQDKARSRRFRALPALRCRPCRGDRKRPGRK
jgi:hypothetical protein